MLIGNSVIEVQRSLHGATVHVSGPLTSSSYAQLGEVLDWIVAIKAPQCSVHLATNHGIDSALLQLLRTTRTQLAGELIVTTDSADLQTPLQMAGLANPKPAR